MVLTAAGSLWATIVLMPGTWRSYFETQERYGPKSDEVGKYVARLVFGVVGIGFAFFILFALIFKHSGI